MKNTLLKAQVKINGRKLSFGERALSAFLLYACLLIFHGYIFGHGDQIEIVPVLFQMDHPEIYQSDFFIQHIIQKPVHERWFFVQTIHFFRLFSPVIFLLLHALFSIILILGMDKIAQLFIRQPVFRWVSIICILLLSYNINLGGNELYYNSFIPSLVAKALSVWAIYYAITEQWNRMVPLLIVATFIQPLVGIQVMLLSFLGALPFSTRAIFKSLKKILIPYSIVLIFILPWLFLLYTQHARGDISNTQLFEILEFRLSHHFFPGWFSTKGYIVLSILALISFLTFMKKAPFVSRYIAWTCIGCIVYTIGVEWLEISLFLNTQWFKTTIWVKAFGFISVFSLLEQSISRHNFRFFSMSKWFDSRLANWYVPILTIILLLSIKISPLPFIKNRPYDFPWEDTMTPEKEISLKATELSDINAVFVVPPHFTMFKWYSKRNTYVDYKAMIHHKDVMAEWYERIKFLYNLDLETKKKAPDLDRSVAQYHRELTTEDFQEWQIKGIDYLITEKSNRLPMPQLASNSAYVIYALTSEVVD